MSGPAWVYVLDLDHGAKVGMTQMGPGSRLSDFERGYGLPGVAFLRTWRFEKTSDARQVEKGAHWFLRDTRTVGEWFHCHPLEAVDAVEAAIRDPRAYVREQCRALVPADVLESFQARSAA